MKTSNLRLDISLFKRLWAYLIVSKKSVWGALGLIIIARLIDAWVPIRLGWLAQEMLANEKNFAYFLKEILILIGLVLVGFQLDALAVWLKSLAGSKGLLQLRKDVFSHIQRLPVSYFDKHPVGQLLTRTMHDVNQINQMFSESLLPLFGSLILFGLIFIGMFWLDWRAALVVMLVFPLEFWLTNHFRLVQRAGHDKVRAGVQEMNTFVNEHLQGVNTIRHFGLQKQEATKFDKINDTLCEYYLVTNKNFGFYIAGNDFLQSTAIALSYLIIAYPGPFEAALFFSFTLYIMMIFRPLLDIAERYNVLQSAFSAAERIFSVLDESIEEDIGETIGEIETIEFKDVWFAYNPGEWVLKGVSFKINPGESIALVGQTGSGKSTVMSLILRFYDIQKGQILINQRPIDTIKLSSLRRGFSVVLQDPVIFSGTLEENVTLFDPKISPKEVQKALAYVNFTKTGPLKPNSLSVGERQLVSLARAASHPGRFFMLDEATAHIDALTESALQEAYKKLIHGRSALVIAHRLSTIRDLSRILVFTHGRLVESGSHTQLIQQKGVYEKLYRLESA